MFWNKKAPPPVAEAAPVTVVVDEDGARQRARVEHELDASLEAVAGVLRALGKHCFPLADEVAETIGKRFEAWASHTLVLAPVPEGDGAAPERREWARLVRFVEAHRKREQTYVVATTTSMREAILTMIGCFGSVSLGQSRSDAVVTEQLERLRTTVETGSIEQLQREALAVTEVVARAIEEQRQRTREQTGELRKKLAALREQLDEAEHDRETDPLTKLFNRRAFDAALERTTMMASVLGRPMSLLLVDIDHFKLINDRYGHPAGDHVLRELANVLTRSFPRRSDMVARYGGEEFAVVLAETSAADARRLAARFLQAVRALNVTHGSHALRVTASVGVAELTEAEAGAELLARADRALYRAKSSGRDRVIESVPTSPSGAVSLDQAEIAKHKKAS